MYEDDAVINVRARDENIRERDGFLEILAPPRKPKLGFDTYAGWLAYVMPNDRVFVKRFPRTCRNLTWQNVYIIMPVTISLTLPALDSIVLALVMISQS
jgi:hypothetical protein